MTIRQFNTVFDFSYRVVYGGIGFTGFKGVQLLAFTTNINHITFLSIYRGVWSKRHSVYETLNCIKFFLLQPAHS